MEKEEYKRKKKELKRKYKSDKRDLKEAYKKKEELPQEEEEVEVREVEKGSAEFESYLHKDVSAQKRKELGLPRYDKGEEIFNSVTHIVGGGAALIMLVLGFVFAYLKKRDPIVVISMAVFGIASVLLYTVSAVYHGLHVNKGKKVFQILDHCTIYLLIAGTYTPVCTVGLQAIEPWNYLLLGIVWTLSVLGIVLNATMMDKLWVKAVSMVLYIAVGWCIIFFYPLLVGSMTEAGMWLLIGGGISYTVGSVLYGIGHSKKYFHSVFHLFVNLGTLLQYLAILLYLVIRIQE